MFQRLGRMEGATLALLLVERAGDIEQSAENDQASQAEHCAETGNEVAHLKARCGASGWKLGGPGHARAAPSGNLPPGSQEGGSIRIGQPERGSFTAGKIDLIAASVLGDVQRLVRLFEPVLGGLEVGLEG